LAHLKFIHIVPCSNCSCSNIYRCAALPNSSQCSHSLRTVRYFERPSVTKFSWQSNVVIYKSTLFITLYIELYFAIKCSHTQHNARKERKQCTQIYKLQTSSTHQCNINSWHIIVLYSHFVLWRIRSAFDSNTLHITG
jgi:hypothetical protein